MGKRTIALRAKHLGYTLVLPIAVFALTEVICLLAAGRHLLGDYVDFLLLVRTTTSTTCIGLALSCNVTSGRFDFSLGAILVVSSILGGNIAAQFALGGMGMLVIAIISGAILGLIVGFVYIITKITPIILSLGAALIFEAISFWLYDSKGFKAFGVPGLELLSNPLFLVVLIVVVVAVMSILNYYTGFGFRYRALAKGQDVAVSSGVKEKKNTIVCYTLAGCLIAIAGVIKCAYQGGQDPAMGLASVGVIFSAYLPVFIGGFWGKYSNDTIGLFVGALSISILGLGMSNMLVPLSRQSLVNAVILLVFLVFLNNNKIISNWNLQRKRIETAIKDNGER
jgi:ribose transport system permease protein